MIVSFYLEHPQKLNVEYKKRYQYLPIQLLFTNQTQINTILATHVTYKLILQLLKK